MKARATYRLQMQPGFGFKEALEVIPYLTELGVSHVYTSPYLQAVEGSSHGYDIVDPTRVNEQLGTAEEHQQFCEAIQAAGLQHLIDLVPNHMSIQGKQNPWWWDVLENGSSSRYAAFFDVDWAASDERWPNKVLLPILAGQYGRILEAGEIKLELCEGHFILQYQTQAFPVDPSSLPGLLNRVAENCDSEMLAFLAQSYARLPRPTVTSRAAIERRHRDKDVLLQLFQRLCQEEPELLNAIQAEINRMNHDADALDSLIEQQNYRLAFWRTAMRDLGYRRFFDIKDLVGLRMEDPDVFQATHALLLTWFKKGWVQGLRIDHPDGLRNPEKYFNLINETFPGAWVLAEKILEPGEKICSSWCVAGTTGYDFIFLTDGLFVNQANEKAFTDLYERWIGHTVDYEELVYQCKLQVLLELFGSEVNRLGTLFVTVCEKHRRHRDYTLFELKEAIRQTAACFPVYRSYVAENLVSEEDKQVIKKAITRAGEKKTDLDPELFHFFEDLLLLRHSGELELELAMRFQQLTGPVMAKGFEDTLLYRYNRLIALNEVGGDPSSFGISLDTFHSTCQRNQKRYPYSLLASSTHDTKRSEDVRARLMLLSEIPEAFSQALERWYRPEQLDSNTQYLLFQTLIGAWPISQERLSQYMQKAIREAKEFTSWTKQNEEYEKSVQDFVTALMQDQTFISDLEQFVKPLIEPGRINALSQTLLKMTAPGIPDFYQGTETWSLTLVDPDNRQRVNFQQRHELLNQVQGLSAEQVMSRMEEGAPKLWLIHKTLQTIKTVPEFAELAYMPLEEKEEHFVAFLRGNQFVTVVPRLILSLDKEKTSLDLPEGNWSNVFTGAEVKGTVCLKELLGNFPVAFLKSKDS